MKLGRIIRIALPALAAVMMSAGISTAVSAADAVPQTVRAAENTAYTADTQPSGDSEQEKQQYSKPPIFIMQAKIILPKSTYTYTGRAIIPQDIKVIIGDKLLVKDRDYRISLNNNIGIGYETASVEVIGKGGYIGSLSKRFSIVPAEKQISSISTCNDAIKVTWEEDKQVLGYQILYSTSKDFSDNVHSTTVTGKNHVNLSNIPKTGEQWYVRMRSFITDSGEISGKRFGTYGKAKKITVKDSIRSVTIPYCSYTFSGKAITPPVKVKGTGGRLLTEGKDYTVKYSENVNVGKAKITVTGKGDIQGSFEKSFIVKPAKNALTLLISSAKGSFTAAWKADSTAAGYQVLYSTDPDFKKDVHSYSTTGTRANFTKHTEPGKTYYVKVRSYFAANGTRYGNYSRPIKVTTLVRDINVLKYRLNSAISTYPGEWSVYVKNLRTGECISINDKQYYAASLTKLYCMAATYEAIEKGQLTETPLVRSLLYYMITYSSNDSFNYLVHMLGKTAVRDWIIRNGYTMTEQYHGYSGCQYYAYSIIEPGKSNLTSASDCARFFESVYRGTCVSPAASQKMLSLLKQQTVRYKAPTPIPSWVQTANKTGEVNNNSHDCMLVFLNGDPYIFSIMTQRTGAAWSNISYIRTLSKITYDFFSQNRY